MNIEAQSKKPNIAILTIKNSYQYGGVFSSLQVVHDFCMNYFEPTVFCLSFDPEISTSIRRGQYFSTTRVSFHHGMKYVEVGARWAFWEPGHYQWTAAAWRNLLKHFDYIFAVSGTCIAAHPALLVDRPFVLWASTLYDADREQRVAQLRGLRWLIDRCAHQSMLAIEKKIMRSADVVFALSRYSEEQFAPLMGDRASRIVPCGFPIDIPHHVADVRDPIIIAVGRFSDPRKNIEMLLRVFNRVYECVPAARLIVVGSKPVSVEYEQYITPAAFQKIHFTGQLSRDALNTMYEQASVQVITSHQEGFAIVGIEGMSCGVPVISTRCGGPSSYVKPGLTGYLVEIDDDREMAEKIVMLFNNPDELRCMRIQARNFVEMHYSKNAIYDIFRKGLMRAYPELAKPSLQTLDNDGDKSFLRC